MKKTIFKLSFAILFAIVSLFAAKTAYSQVPDAINFQAIARNANGDVLANTEIMLRLSILDGSAEGTQVYSEVRTLTTNNYGSFSFQIGRDVTDFEGDFSAIDWSANDKFIKIDYDPTASSNFDLSLGTIEFVTVPYAFTARDVIYIDANGATDGDMLIFNATTGKFEPGQVSAGNVTWDNIDGKPDFAEVATSGDYNSLINKPENLSNFNNDLTFLTEESQNLSDVLNKGTDADGKNITNLANPTNAQDAATKAYVDANSFDGNYNSLINKPENLSDFTNDLTFLTEESQNLSDVLNKGTDAGNKNITNLANPANSQDAATKFYVDSLRTDIGANVDDLVTRSDIYEAFFTFIDSRDNNVYKTVKIGNQIWMAENLKYLPSVVEHTTTSNTQSYYYVYDYDGTDVDEAKATPNYNTYGVMYNWTSAMSACPAGWHLPSDAEWTQLTDYLGENAGGKLKEAGTEHWDSPNEGATNESGFTALPGGYLANNGYFTNVKIHGGWWTSTQHETQSTYVYNRVLLNSSISVSKFYDFKRTAFSVRCVKNASDDWSSLNNTPTTIEGYGITDANLAGVLAQGKSAGSKKITDLANPEDAQDAATKAYVDALETTVTILETTVTILETTVTTLEAKLKAFEEYVLQTYGCTDIRDGNNYNVVKIGEQFWLAENLKYLPNVVGPATGSTTEPYCYVYNYNDTDVAAAKATSEYATYGVLYNWPAAMNGAESSGENPSGVQGICPEGWHLPSYDEWMQLITYLGGMTEAGGKLKEVGTAHWNSPNEGANNETGFTALGGGYRDNDGNFANIKDFGHWWTTTVSGTPWFFRMNHSSGAVENYYYLGASPGFSVRCVKNN